MQWADGFAYQMFYILFSLVNKSNITKKLIRSAIFNIKNFSEKVLIFAERIILFYILGSLT